MNACIEYVLVCLGNYFTTGQEPDVSAEMDPILDEIIEYIKSTNILDDRSEQVLQCCIDDNHYGNTIETLLFRDSITHAESVDWSLITFIFVLFVKVITIRTSIGTYCYDVLYDTQTLMAKYDISRRIRSQQGNWKNIVDAIKTTKQ